MMSVLLVFLGAAAISFAGSLQPGPMNLMVLRNTLLGRTQTAWGQAVGFSLPEALYSGVALLATHWLPLMSAYGLWVRLLALVVVGIVCAVFWRQPPVELEGTVPKATGRWVWGGLFTGLGLGLANVQLPLFWAGVVVLGRGAGLLQTPAEQLALLAGAPVGSFLLHWGVIRLGQRLRLSELAPMIGRILRFTFWLLAGLWLVLAADLVRYLAAT